MREPPKYIMDRYPIYHPARNLEAICRIISSFEELSEDPAARFGCHKVLMKHGLSHQQAERAILLTLESAKTPCGEWWFLPGLNSLA